MIEWEFVKDRTAAAGAVWRSADGRLYKRTGGPEVGDEAGFQARLHGLGFPVPEILETGSDGSLHFFVERSAGPASMHELVVAAADPDGLVPPHVLLAAHGVAGRLLAAQQRHARLPDESGLRAWFEKASFIDIVLEENPDFDSRQVQTVVEKLLRRLGELPVADSHMDFGLPNAFPAAVIDWQHFGFAPLGYDVYPTLEIAAFKGGNRGYAFPDEQTADFRAAMDAVLAAHGSPPLSGYQGEFLMVKCFFFLALMRPGPTSAHDKHLKWQYRRHLFRRGLEQYEATGAVDTGSFPTLADFGRAASGSGMLTWSG